MTEKGNTKSDLEIELERTGPEAMKWYLKLLARRRVELTKKAKGYANVTEADRLSILNHARQKAQYGSANAEKMAKDWDSRDQRAPIGGSQDD